MLEIIGFIHVVLCSIISLYWLWSSKAFDIFYLFYFLTLNLSWVIMNNECFISYFFKVLEDPNYKMGQNNEVKDFEPILGKTGSVLFNQYLLTMNVINLFLILTRSFDSFRKIAIALFILSYTFYIEANHFSFINKDSRKKIYISHGIISFVVLAYFLNSWLKSQH